MGRTIWAIIQNDSVSPAAAIALVLACGATLAACGTATVPSAIAPAHQDAATSAPASPQQPSPKQRAKADAAWIAGSFVPPPGSKRLPGVPGGVVGGALTQPVDTPVDPDVVDDSSVWQVPGAPSDALAFTAAHLPRQFHREGGGTGSYGGPGFLVTIDDFGVQSGLGPLDTGYLQVESTTSASGQTYLRVDAVVTWQPTRPAATFLPAGRIHAVVVSAAPGMNDPTKPPAPVTVTDPATVAQLVSLVNGLPLFPPGEYNCPQDDGRGMQMEFWTTVGGTRLATAFAKHGGCGGMELLLGAGEVAATNWGTVRGEIGLGPVGSDPARQVLTISGMNWKLDRPIGA
jgi:hypothetical protein